MLLVLIIALIATAAFYRQAKAVNVHPGKAASVPFLAAGLILIAEYCTSFLLNTFAAWAGADTATVRVTAFMANVFLLLAYLLLISRNWRSLTTAAHIDSC